MDFKIFQNNKDNILSQNAILKISVALMTVSNIYLVTQLVNNSNSQRTVFLPPQNTYKEFWVSGDVVSESYKQMIGNFIAQNMLNISYNNANLIVSNILPLVHSDTYKQVRLELKKMVNYIISNDISRSFFISKIDITQKDKIIVHGSITDFITSKVLRNKDVSLEIDYTVKYGQFFIVNLKLNGLVELDATKDNNTTEENK
jgi:conjugal transfer pilus assembly protein TraE